MRSIVRKLATFQGLNNLGASFPTHKIGQTPFVLLSELKLIVSKFNFFGEFPPRNIQNSFSHYVWQILKRQGDGGREMKN